MIHFLKKLKPVHWLYNILHYRHLKHNRDAFKAMGIHKQLFASLSAKDFPDKQSRAWLDVGDSSKLVSSANGFSAFEAVIQQKIKDWSENGFIVLDRFISPSDAENINSEIESLLKSGKIKFENGNKIMFANHKSKLIDALTRDPQLCSILKFILDKEVIPFQTINFITGSQQRAHSDSIHMTTYPLGYLIAVWIALEDITDENGPLFYYPGSHKLPYVLNEDFNSGDTALMLGDKDYDVYEDVIEKSVTEKKYQKVTFLAKKGDAFIWHANLVHGGAQIIDASSTRKSMVIHYFAKDVIKYHEITERPSLIKE